jgi:hypothetical protein
MHQRFIRGGFARALGALLFAAALAASAPAQVTTGTLQGVVVDPNKAAVSGATVTVTNTETGISKTTTTNDGGLYRVTNLTPGELYRVEVTSAGFATATLEPVRVLLGGESAADITLGLAQVGGEVNVTSEQQLLDTTQSQLSTNYTPEQVTQLPINGLVDNLALLVPGVVRPGDIDFANGVGISANGNRGRSNNFQIDGQDNNDLSIGGPSTFITNQEAIGEFQVVTSTFSAEFGRNAGAQINTITRPGTNEFHGAVFQFHQNSALNARNNIEKQTARSFDFLASNGFPQFQGFADREGEDPNRQNRFGFRLGGPIKKNKAFFFVTYEGTYFRGEQAFNNVAGGAVTPTLESIQAAALLFPGATTAQLASTTFGGGPAAISNFGQFLIAPQVVDTDGDGTPDTFAFGPGNPFGNPVTPGFLTPLAVVADPTATGGRRTLFGGEAVRLFRTDATSHQIITREDFQITDRDQVTARYIFSDSDNPFVVSRILGGSPISVPSRSHNLGVTYTRTLSSRFVNEARFTFSHLDVKFGDPDTDGPFTPNINFGGSPQALPNDFGIGGDLLDFGTQTTAPFPQGRVVDVYQLQDNVTATLGNHGLKFGVDYRRDKEDDFFLPNIGGSFTFNAGTSVATSGVVPAGFFTFGSNGLNGDPRTGELATSFENFLLNRPRDIDFAVGDATRIIQQDYIAFFLQDDWRVRPNLTVNLGLRYEYNTQPLNRLVELVNAREANDATALFDPSFPLSSRTAQTLPTDKNNFGPVVGFAYQPNFGFLGERFTGGRTVIRGGFRIAYDPGFFNILNNVISGAPFTGIGRIRQTPGGATSLPFPFQPTSRADLNLTPGTGGGNPLLFDQIRVDPQFYNPYTMSWNLGVEQEIYRNGVVKARYVGSRIVGQFQLQNTNPQLNFLNDAADFLGLDPGAFTSGFIGGSNPGTNGNGRLNPNQGFTLTVNNSAQSSYHALQTEFNTRLTNSLTAFVNYTFSKTIDNASEIFSSAGGGQTINVSQNPFDILGGERGLSGFHQKHNFNASVLYELPFFKSQKGWVGKLLGGYQLNGIVELGSGRPYTPTTVFGYDPRSLGIRPFTGNPDAPEGTIAFSPLADAVLFGSSGLPLNSANWVLFDTRNTGSGPRIVTTAEALSQARFIYNDFGLIPALGSSAFLPFARTLELFGTPYGDVGRNTFIGEPRYNVNASIFKTTRITENTQLELRVEAFNLLNHRNFGVPDPLTEDAFNGFTVSSFQNPGFNAGNSRVLQFGARFIF